MNLRSLTLFVAILAALSASLAGCGRRSALDTPSQAAAREARTNRAGTANAGSEAEKPVEDKRFVLDGLIE